jgi:hypothetical protein
MKIVGLAIVVIIGAVSPAALRAQSDTSRRAPDSAVVRRETTSMKSALRELLTVQEVYFTDHTQYAAKISDLSAFKLQPGLKVTSLKANAQGWSGIIESDRLAGVQCAVAIGGAMPNPIDKQAMEGVPTCR